MHRERIEELLAALDTTLLDRTGRPTRLLPRVVARETQMRDALADGRLVDVSEQLPRQELDVKIVRPQRTMSPLAGQAWNRIAGGYRKDGCR